MAPFPKCITVCWFGYTSKGIGKVKVLEIADKSAFLVQYPHQVRNYFNLGKGKRASYKDQGQENQEGVNCYLFILTNHLQWQTHELGITVHKSYMFENWRLFWYYFFNFSNKKLHVCSTFQRHCSLEKKMVYKTFFDIQLVLSIFAGFGSPYFFWYCFKIRHQRFITIYYNLLLPYFGNIFSYVWAILTFCCFCLSVNK